MSNDIAVTTIAIEPNSGMLGSLVSILAGTAAVVSVLVTLFSLAGVLIVGSKNIGITADVEKQTVYLDVLVAKEA